MIGTELAHYRITAKLGEGGMGEVWRATDTKLGREVAIKVLPESFSSDPERLARFEREAKVLASLNHPHIAAIYGLEEAGGGRALVLELVEGPTLGERLAQGLLPLEEALTIARQIADGIAERAVGAVAAPASSVMRSTRRALASVETGDPPWRACNRRTSSSPAAAKSRSSTSVSPRRSIR